MAAFDKLGVVDELCRATEAMGWQLPTDVQDESIPLILGGGDVLIAAETGSGKTGAFALPLLQIVHETLRGKARAGRDAGVALREAQAGADPAEAARLNAGDRDAFVAVSPDGRVAQARDQRRWGGVRGTWGAAPGTRAYFECRVEDEGLCRVGWASAKARREVGTCAESLGFGGTGKKSYNRAFDDYGEAFGLGDVIGCSLDGAPAGGGPPTVSFCKNGRDLGVAYTVPEHLRGVPLFPAVVLKNAEMSFDFAPPAASVPAGFTAVAALPPASRAVFQAPAPAAAADAAAAAPGPASTPESLRRNPLALIMEPTRELALQIYDELTKFKRFLSDPEITHELVIGGSGSKSLTDALARGVNILVGTPGRLGELVKSGKVNLSECRYFVLDEADSLIKDGGRRLVMDMFGRLRRDVAQVVVSSATLHTDEIRRLSEDICHHPTWVDLKGRDSVPENVDHVAISVDPLLDESWRDAAAAGGAKTDGVHAADESARAAGSVSAEALSEAVKRLKPQYVARIIKAFGMAERQAILFARTQLDCDNLAAHLRAVPYKVAVLHSGLPQKQRTGNLASFRSGEASLLVCTDVAARGIDVAGLPFVINVSLPDMAETYIHRIGRVGRADAAGLAVSLVSTVNEKVWFHTCGRRGRGGCTNTRHADKGGCCVWMNEPDLMLGVEVRLGGMDVARLGIDSVEAGGVAEFQRRAADIRAKGDLPTAAATSHLRFLSGHVERLAALETQAQEGYHRIRGHGRWAAMLRESS